ncbi:MAG: tetratricopeptide repeat protein [Alphaproteobacteria bacterium]|nr:tetratricopeptide repeat protein [Alphaproteobacteria bacterium]
MHEGHCEPALEHGRRALALAPEDLDILNFCAWLFSNAERHDEAAAIYGRMLETCPDWAEGHRHASGSLAAIGERDRALAHAERACDLLPECAEFLLHAGHLLLAAEQFETAAFYFSRAAAAAPDDGAAWRAWSSACLALDRPEEALSLALHALTAAPDDPENARHAAELMMRAGRPEEAVEIAAGLAAREPSPATLRLLSAAEMVCDRPQPALDAVERALELAPFEAEYHLHRGGLLYRLGQLDRALDAFRRAADLDAANPDAKRSALTAYVESGRLDEALATGGELLSAHPENAEFAQAVLHVLNQRLDILDADYVLVADRTLRPARPYRPPPGWLDRLRAQGRVLNALIIRETRTRFGEARLGYGWALIEPILHILVLSLVFAVLMQGRPPIGTHFFVFYYTGLLPYYLFVHTSSAMTYAITSNGALLQLPLVTTFDVVLARGVLEAVTDLLVAAILLAGFTAMGLDAVPADVGTASVSLLAIAGLGCGCGFINAVLDALFKSWDKVWVQLTRVLYFCSGIFYVPGMMSERVRDCLAWNPVLQGIDWFRSGFFPFYEPHWLDRGYVAVLAVTAMLAGLGLERGLRRRLSPPP